MIRVTSEGKQQVYCQLCSVKLRFSGSVHFASHNHQFNYLVCEKSCCRQLKACKEGFVADINRVLSMFLLENEVP